MCLLAVCFSGSFRDLTTHFPHGVIRLMLRAAAAQNHRRRNHLIFRNDSQYFRDSNFHSHFQNQLANCLFTISRRIVSKCLHESFNWPKVGPLLTMSCGYSDRSAALLFIRAVNEGSRRFHSDQGMAPRRREIGMLVCKCHNRC